MTTKLTGVNQIKEDETSELVRGIRRRDRTAVHRCIETYGNFVFALTSRCTGSREEAEVVTRQIFKDIWRHAARPEVSRMSDEQYISWAARRRLFQRVFL